MRVSWCQRRNQRPNQQEYNSLFLVGLKDGVDNVEPFYGTACAYQVSTA